MRIILAFSRCNYFESELLCKMSQMTIRDDKMDRLDSNEAGLGPFSLNQGEFWFGLRLSLRKIISFILTH